MQPQEILALAQRVNEGVDKVIDSLEGWTPEEILILAVGIARAIAEFHPETRELAISQLSLAWRRIENPETPSD